MVSNAPVRRAVPPLIAHVVFRFDYGGLENGLVNLINRMPGDAFRHCVIALTEVTDFRDRLQQPTVAVYALGKRPGKDFGAYLRLYRLLRKLRPQIVHTRNVGTLDCAPVARLAGVPLCIHGEHGWDVHDPDGTNSKYRRLRRLVYPLLRRVITVSNDLQQWLVDSVGISRSKLTHVCNGVDTGRFRPDTDGRQHAELCDRFAADIVIVGSVLRFMDIKDPMNLVDAFIKAHRMARQGGVELGLVMVGDGPLRQGAIDALDAAGLGEAAWLPGSRDDVPALMRSFDLFVLGSRREGISNTLLEAMASGLPVIATETGGNVELVRPGFNGALVQPQHSDSLAQEIVRYGSDSAMRAAQGQSARMLALQDYSLDTMVCRYQRIYQGEIAGAKG